jgi:hypothetical protein
MEQSTSVALPTDKTGRVKRLPAFPLAVLAVSALIIAVLSVVEDPVFGLIEVAFLLMGLWGSYVLGQRADLKPHVGKAYRRMARLYAQLYALSELIAHERQEVADTEASAASGRADASFHYIGFVVGLNRGFRHSP